MLQDQILESWYQEYGGSHPANLPDLLVCSAYCRKGARLNPSPILPGCRRLGTWWLLSFWSWLVLDRAAGKLELNILFCLDGLGLLFHLHKANGKSVPASAHLGEKDGVTGQGDTY